MIFSISGHDCESEYVINLNGPDMLQSEFTNLCDRLLPSIMQYLMLQEDSIQDYDVVNEFEMALFPFGFTKIEFPTYCVFPHTLYERNVLEHNNRIYGFRKKCLLPN